MLALSVYENTKQDIYQLGDKYTLELQQHIQDAKHIQPVIKAAYATANAYHSEYVPLVFSRLHDVGLVAMDHYAPEMSNAQKAQQVDLAVDEMVHSRYYGLTLPQRLKQSHLELRSSIKRSAVTGAKQETRFKNITRVFNQTYPYGAHRNWDVRLFLAEAIRLEHILARNIAHQKNLTFVRWTLSHSHSQHDICDQLATVVDPAVKAAMDNVYKEDPGGVYFLRDTPKVPHPNCQCSITYLGKPKPKVIKTVHTENFLRRLIRRIFGR